MPFGRHGFTPRLRWSNSPTRGVKLLTPEAVLRAIVDHQEATATLQRRDVG